MNLFNLVVRDESNRGWAVGHFVSNNMSAAILELFIREVKSRCVEGKEELIFNGVLSDDDKALINGIEAEANKILFTFYVNCILMKP